MRTIVSLFLVLQLSTESLPQGGRHRAARPPCAPPTLLLRASKSAICPGEFVTLSWQASDPQATVSIVGIGASLPASGSQFITTTSPLQYTGHASNVCGTGSEVFAELTLQQRGSASVGASPSSITQGQTSTVAVNVSGVSIWSLLSALGNPFSVSSGTTSQSVIYTGTRSGSDVITLAANDGCGQQQPTTSIQVSPTSSPPPPPQTGTLRCCDGTFSPTCNSCAHKQGCCSSHGGVCGCP